MVIIVVLFVPCFDSSIYCFVASLANVNNCAQHATPDFKSAIFKSEVGCTNAEYVGSYFASRQMPNLSVSAAVCTLFYIAIVNCSFLVRATFALGIVALAHRTTVKYWFGFFLVRRGLNFWAAPFCCLNKSCCLTSGLGVGWVWVGELLSPGTLPLSTGLNWISGDYSTKLSNGIHMCT